MKLLVWACSLCLIGNGVSGVFFDGLSTFFGGKTEETAAGMKPVNSNTTAAGILDEMEQTADSLDGLWLQFRKELVNLVNSFSSSDDVDGHSTTPTVPTTGNIMQWKPKPNDMNAKTTTTTAATPTSTTKINVIEKQELSSSTPLP